MLKATTTRRTFRLDTFRAVPAGVIETVSTTFSILLADRVFDAGIWAKASLVAIPSLGLFLSLFVVQGVRRSGLSINAALAWIFVMAAAGFSVAAMAGTDFRIYFGGMFFGLIGVTLNVPLFAQIYRRHYPDETRGKLFSMTAFIRKIFAIGGAALFGLMLTKSLASYPLVLGSYAFACLVMAGCVLGINKVTLRKANSVKLFDAFRHTSEDRPFRNLLISWMVLGLGNLLCFSLFVEYITNKEYGFYLTERHVSVITTVIPETFFLIFILVWGRLFDRMNFYVLRMLINIVFAIGILFYFLGDGLWALYIGIAFHGIARAGGNVAWSLWVTKFANAENVAEYMSVHTFLTGCRGVIAPFIAFQMAASLGPFWVGFLGAGMIFIATAMIMPAMRDSLRSEKNLPA
ncbi:MFS transporter [Akkermansiaceae bacterium]|nr:MFS transporter [Akkermansiaceae bacterium]